MDEEWSSPYPASSFQDGRALNQNTADFNKKRKLSTEEFDLPDPKHKCWDHDCPPNISSTFGVKPEIIYLSTRKEKTKMGNSTDALQPESVKDSNSYSDDCDTATSIHSEARIVKEIAAKETSIAGEGLYYLPNFDSEANMRELLEEQFLEFGSYIDYDLLESGKDCFMECADEEAVEDTGKSNALNPDNYILSSARQIFKQESNVTPRTIDQEFEEYFSTLMM